MDQLIETFEWLAVKGRAAWRDSNVSVDPLAPVGEECGQQGGAVGLGKAGINLGLVVALRMAEHFRALLDATGFRIGRAVIKPGDTGK